MRHLHAIDRYIIDFGEAHPDEQATAGLLHAHEENSLKEISVNPVEEAENPPDTVTDLSEAEAVVVPVAETRAPSLEEMLCLAREKWLHEQAEILLSGLDNRMNQLSCELKENIASVLAPFVKHAVLQRILEDFDNAVVVALSGHTDGVVEIEGAEDLVSLFSERLSNRGFRSKTRICESTEIRFQLDATIIETRIQEWIRLLDAEVEP